MTFLRIALLAFAISTVHAEEQHHDWDYGGSLTTPPCSEGVTWYVLVHPSEMSAAQVARFGKIYAHNARPVQPLNGRVVRVSQ